MRSIYKICNRIEVIFAFYIKSINKDISFALLLARALLTQLETLMKGKRYPGFNANL